MVWTDLDLNPAELKLDGVDHSRALSTCEHRAETSTANSFAWQSEFDDKRAQAAWVRKSQQRGVSGCSPFLKRVAPIEGPQVARREGKYRLQDTPQTTNSKAFGLLLWVDFPPFWGGSRETPRQAVAPCRGLPLNSRPAC